jgi:hypothetical protein
VRGLFERIATFPQPLLGITGSSQQLDWLREPVGNWLSSLALNLSVAEASGRKKATQANAFRAAVHALNEACGDSGIQFF